MDKYSVCVFVCVCVPLSPLGVMADNLLHYAVLHFLVSSTWTNTRVFKLDGWKSILSVAHFNL